MASKTSYADALKGTSTPNTRSCPNASPTVAQSSSMASPTVAQSSSMASPTPGPSSSMASSKSPQSPSVPKSVHADCMFHSPKWMHVCQYVSNNLYKERLLAGRMRREFFKKICFCDEQSDFNSLFKNRAQASDYVHFSITEISKWKKAPKTLKKLLDHCAEFDNGEDISVGFLKFLYYFKKSYEGEFKVS